MINCCLLATEPMRDLIRNEESKSSEFSMSYYWSSYADYFANPPSSNINALILQALFPIGKAQELLQNLEEMNILPAILMFDILPDGTIHYAISNNTYIPASALLADIFENALCGVFPCKRLRFRSAPLTSSDNDTIYIKNPRQDALEELLLGCSAQEIQGYKSRYKLDFRDNGYYLYFWELNYTPYRWHNIYKDVYNFKGQLMKRECHEILAHFNGGEFFYLKLTQACIIINDFFTCSESQKNSMLRILINQLALVTGSKKSICYFSNRIKRIEDFRIYYDRYFSERECFFFIKDSRVIRSAFLPELKKEANVEEVNEVLNKIVRYLSYDLCNSSLDRLLRELFLETLKQSLNMPMYYYCAAVIGSSLTKLNKGDDEKVITQWLDSNRLLYSSIEEIYLEISDIIKKLRNKFGINRQTKKTLVMNAIEYIQEFFQSDITVAQIAKSLYVSETYLERIFKETLNTSVIRYLINCRLHHAKHLLEKTDFTVFAIAEQCGFHDARHFSKTFKAHIGYTPSEYRAILFETKQ